ncbi:MAG: dinitrogenase iron-molybdenum cofactor biosynthesis protein [Clostridiales bacterium]|nr:dinitrogenase iron-molybdenum cofactor biosynthesis protein [Clostridiales bacterium]
MRIAVPYEKGDVFQPFGHTKRLKVYDIKDREIIVTTIVNTNGTSQGALADLLGKGKINILLCGGLGEGAQKGLTKAGIQWYKGVKGNADQAVENYLQGKLEYEEKAKSNHFIPCHKEYQSHCCTKE